MAPIQLSTPAAALQLRGQGRETHEVSDRVLAGLVYRRLQLLRRQGWTAFGLFGAALTGLICTVFCSPSTAVLGIASTGIATLAFCLGFFVEHAARWRFQSEARLCGLSAEAGMRLYARAAQAEDTIEILRACGAEPSHEELANFVR